MRGAQTRRRIGGRLQCRPTRAAVTCSPTKTGLAAYSAPMDIRVVMLGAGLILLTATAAAARAGNPWAHLVRPWQVWLAVGLIIVSLSALRTRRR